MIETPTAGSVAFSMVADRLGHAHVSRLLGVSPGTVSNWAQARRCPGVPVRRKIAKAFPEVPAASWTEPAPAPAEQASRTRKPRAGAAQARHQGSTPDELTVGALLTEVREQLAAARAEKHVSYRERAQLVNSALSILKFAARLRGELEVTQQQILRSRHWRELMAKLDAVLERHPVAAAEWLAALQQDDGA